VPGPGGSAIQNTRNPATTQRGCRPRSDSLVAKPAGTLVHPIGAGGNTVVEAAPNSLDGPMALTDTDRRRFTAATVLTLLALPALWLANTSDNSAAPNLAVAGIDPGVEPGADTAQSAGGADVVPDGDKELGAVAPVYFDGPASPAGAGQSPIAIPAQPSLAYFTAKATFRSSVPDGACIIGGLASGTLVTIVNLANDRSATCTTMLSPGDDSGDVVMHRATFAAIADLTNSPIAVEIRR
jgi:hypothetical protein